MEEVVQSWYDEVFGSFHRMVGPPHQSLWLGEPPVFPVYHVLSATNPRTGRVLPDYNVCYRLCKHHAAILLSIPLHSGATGRSPWVSRIASGRVKLRKRHSNDRRCEKTAMKAQTAERATIRNKETAYTCETHLKNTEFHGQGCKKSF